MAEVKAEPRGQARGGRCAFDLLSFALQFLSLFQELILLIAYFAFWTTLLTAQEFFMLKSLPTADKVLSHSCWTRYSMRNGLDISCNMPLFRHKSKAELTLFFLGEINNFHYGVLSQRLNGLGPSLFSVPIKAAGFLLRLQRARPL